jgi:asparagine synthase (glutamine-hydrolysing)/amidotransferase
MRRLSYLNLTRFVQTLLDRKDRMSMGVGLEVRVPFCDHRLVEYVFNTPWAMKAFDGREKSLLRAAAADLLPASVLGRVKSPYPAIQDPAYEAALRTRLTEVLADPDAPVLPLLDQDKARRVLGRRPASLSQPYDRGSLELTLWLNDWLGAYDVHLDL